MLNAVLSTIPIYTLSMYEVPTWVFRSMDKIRRNILWHGPAQESRGFKLVAWDQVCSSKREGG